MNNLKIFPSKRVSGVKLLFIIFLVINFSSFSQEDTFSREVQVVREYNPSISDAFKINDMPSASDTLKETPLFRYQLKGKALVSPPEMAPITPARLAKEPLDELFPAYIQGYFGNYDVMGGKLIYNLVRNDKFAVALNVSHESSFGDIKLENDSLSEATYHETNAGLYMRHFFNKSTLSVDMDFNNFAYRYYGLGSVSDLKNSAQRQTVFDMKARLNNRVLKSSTQYDVLLGFYTFENKTGITENGFLYNGDFNFALNDFYIRLETAVDYAGSRIEKVSNQNDPLNYVTRDRTLLQLNPALIRKHDNFLIKLGLRIGAGLDDLEDKFYLSPDVGVDFTIENTVMIQVGLTGDLKPNSYRSIMAENPYITTDFNVKTGFHSAKFFAGINGNFNSKTSFGFRVEYGAFTTEHFFVNKIYANSDSTIFNYDNKFEVQYDDGRLLCVSGELKTIINSNLDLVFRAAYYGWKTDSLEKAWHKPNMELGLRAIYKATNDLHFSATFNVLGERFAFMPPETIEKDSENKIIFNTKKLNPVYDFNLNANYTLNSRWHFFCTAQNLFASKYYQYNGYPMHGINVRVGLGFSF